MSYPHDFADDLIRGKKTLPADLLLKLVLAYQKSIQTPETDIVQDNFIYSPLIDKHNTEIHFFEQGLDETDFSKHYSQSQYHKRFISPVKSHPLIYDYSDSNLRFTKPFTDEGVKFGGGAFVEDPTVIRITNNPLIKPNDVISLSFWIYKPIANPTTVANVIGFGGNFNTEPYLLQLSFFGMIGISFNTDVGQIQVFTPGELTPGWHHVIAACKSGSQQFYIDKILVSSKSVNYTSLNTANNDLGIFGNPNNSQFLPAGYGLSWLSIIHAFVPDISNTWIEDAYNGILTFPNNEEITCFPFVDSPLAQPLATSGLFFSD